MRGLEVEDDDYRRAALFKHPGKVITQHGVRIAAGHAQQGGRRRQCGVPRWRSRKLPGEVQFREKMGAVEHSLVGSEHQVRSRSQQGGDGRQGEREQGIRARVQHGGLPVADHAGDLLGRRDRQVHDQVGIVESQGPREVASTRLSDRAVAEVRMLAAVDRAPAAGRTG